MFNWKAVAAEQDEAKHIAQRNKQKEKDEKWRKEVEAWRRQQLEAYRRRFHCHIHGCDRGSLMPREEPSYCCDGVSGGGTYWDEPTGGITLCTKCHRPTCDDHIYNGVCKKCRKL